MEAFFFLEICLKFFTAYKDAETFESIYSLKKIATNYILNQGFVFDLLAAFPYWFIFQDMKKTDPNLDSLRNVMMLKMLRITRLMGEFIADDQLLSIVQAFYRPESRDEKI